MHFRHFLNLVKKIPAVTEFFACCPQNNQTNQCSQTCTPQDGSTLFHGSTNITKIKTKQMYIRHSKIRKKCIAAVLRNNLTLIFNNTILTSRLRLNLVIFSLCLLAVKSEERRMFSQVIFCFDQKHLLG